MKLKICVSVGESGGLLWLRRVPRHYISGMHCLARYLSPVSLMCSAFAFLLFSEDSFAICVSASSAVLRTEASVKSAVSWVVPRYTPLVEIERKGAWVKVSDQDGKTHWAQARQLSKKIRCVSVKTNKVSLRVGPGPQFPLSEIPLADRYTPFKRLEEINLDAENWYPVVDIYGVKHWIPENFLWRPTSVVSVGF